MDKKAVNVTLENIVYTLFLVFFVVSVTFLIVRPSGGVSAYEQIYAKQIALMIDKAEPGMKIEMDIYDIYILAKENDFNGKWINIDNDKNGVKVMLDKGEGYRFSYFNDVSIVWNVDKDAKILSMKIIENLEGKNEEVV
jgi:hypothetical protein